MSSAVSSVSTSPTLTLQHPLSTKKIVDRIRSITAPQIDLISSAITESILNHLGPIGKARVAMEVNEIKGGVNSGPEADMLELILRRADMEMASGRTQFFPEIRRAKFHLVALARIKEEITHHFSHPNFFLETGMFFQISDYRPSKFLDGILKDAGMKLTMMEVPTGLSLLLKLDHELTMRQSELVFEYSESSEGIEFFKKTFTLNGLEPESGFERTNYNLKYRASL